MIDNTEKTATLMEKMRAVLPIGAEITAQTQETLRKESPDRVIPRRCRITSVYYAGDEGGVLCTLDFGVPDTGKVYIVSITHLTVDRRTPPSREVRVYQKHRIKRLRKLDGRLF